MSKLKALILGSLLLVPLFVFIFIYTFGEHHFTLRHYFPELDEEGQVLRNAAGDTIFRKVPDFQLIDQSNGNFSKQDLKGKLYVVNFISTDCESQCRKMSSQLVRVQEFYQNNPDVQLVSISVKPEEDTPGVLQQYAAAYKADTTQWHFLTGNRGQIYGLAQQGFQLPVQQTGGSEGFIHSNAFMLVDRAQLVRGVYKGTDAIDVDRLILEINVLLDEYSKSK